MTISDVLKNKNLIVPGVVYDLSDIYEIVKRHASDLSLTSCKDWRHVVRGVLSSRKVGGRVITHCAWAKYKFD